MPIVFVGIDLAKNPASPALLRRNYAERLLMLTACAGSNSLEGCSSEVGIRPLGAGTRL
jgi:hypothetical protein